MKSLFVDAEPQSHRFNGLALPFAQKSAHVMPGAVPALAPANVLDERIDKAGKFFDVVFPECVVPFQFHAPQLAEAKMRC